MRHIIEDCKKPNVINFLINIKLNETKCESFLL